MDLGKPLIQRMKIMKMICLNMWDEKLIIGGGLNGTKGSNKAN